MGVLPNTTSDLITFCNQHAEIWALDPDGVGLTAPSIALLASAVNTAANSLDAANKAREGSKAATIALKADVATMRDIAADLVRTIKAYAESQANPSAVYAQAQIPEPAAPAPAPLPGVPEKFAVVLNSDGSVTLSWEAANGAASGGVYFLVKRQLPGQSGWTQVGAAGGQTQESRRAFFTDDSIPVSAAAQGAKYIVQGFRGNRAGPASNSVTVQFGVDGTGAFTSASLKMAA